MTVAISKKTSRASNTIVPTNPLLSYSTTYYLPHILIFEGIDDIDLEFISDDMEFLNLKEYSLFLCNTNIPVNQKRYVENPELVSDKVYLEIHRPS